MAMDFGRMGVTVRGFAKAEATHQTTSFSKRQDMPPERFKFSGTSERGLCG